MTIKKPFYAVVLVLVFWLLGCSPAPVQPSGSPVQGPAGPPLVEAAWSGDTDRVAALLHSGADVNAADAEPTSGATALYWAVYRGNGATVRVLLAAGADPKRRTFQNSTPLELAAGSGQTDIAVALLDHGAIVDVQSDKYGSSPLMLASVQGNTAIVEAILAKHPNLELKNHHGQTALFSVSSVGHEDIVKLLLAQGANPNTQRSDGFSALMMAALWRHADIAKLLIEAGANVNYAEDSGFTALMLAAFSGDPETVSILLKSGADPKAREKTGKTALSFAKKQGNHQIIELLKAAGATE